MDAETAEKVGEVADSLDNLIHALMLPMPADLHIKALKESLPVQMNALRSICRDAGHDFWD
jgi:hypothetical protein